MTIAKAIATIDFEASGTDGYPIEVGVAIQQPGKKRISVWSSLIKPTVGLLQKMSWDPVAFQIHGIARAELKNASSPWDVAKQLNALLAPVGVAYCDGWKWDHRWLFLLMQECPDKCAFELRDTHQLEKALGLYQSTLKERDENTTIEHRAGPDAERRTPLAACAKRAPPPSGRKRTRQQPSIRNTRRPGGTTDLPGFRRRRYRHRGNGPPD